MDTEPDIELRGITHRFGDRTVLRDLDLTISHGEIFGFLGHNGAGKTTTVNILTTLLNPTSGTARVCGFDVVTQRAEVTRRIGYLPAEVRLYDHLTALENLEFFGRLSGVPDPRRAARETLDHLGAAALRPRRVAHLGRAARARQRRRRCRGGRRRQRRPGTVQGGASGSRTRSRRAGS